MLNVISAEYFTMKLPEAGIWRTASTNHTQVTDRGEMGAQEIHFQGNSVTGKGSGFSRKEILSRAHKSHLLLISSHSFSHQLCTECQIFLSPGNTEDWAPAGAEPQVLGWIQVCLGSDLPYLVILKPKKEAATSAPGS